MASVRLTQEEIDRETAFSKAMHGKSAEQRNTFLSMMKKDSQTHRMITDDYLNHWTANGKEIDDTEEARDKRREQYMSVVNK